MMRYMHIDVMTEDFDPARDMSFDNRTIYLPAILQLSFGPRGDFNTCSFQTNVHVFTHP